MTAAPGRTYASHEVATLSQALDTAVTYAQDKAIPVAQRDKFLEIALLIRKACE